MPRRTTSEPMPSFTSKSWKQTTSPSAVTCTSNSTKSTMLRAAFWKDSTVFSRTLRPFTLLAPEPLCLHSEKQRLSKTGCSETKKNEEKDAWLTSTHHEFKTMSLS